MTEKLIFILGNVENMVGKGENAGYQREREVMGLIPGHNRLNSLKLVVVAFPIGAQDDGNSTTTGPPVSG